MVVVAKVSENLGMQKDGYRVVINEGKFGC
jgi:hypothetical protein